VHFRISSPPVANPCFYGMDFPTKAELIVNNMSHAEMEKFLNVDSLGYLSADGMMAAVGMDEKDFCKACFDGHYPVGMDGQTGEQLSLDKLALESKAKCN